MIAPRQQVKRRNHTVNKAYLKRFADSDGQLIQVALPGVKRVTVPVDDAAVQRTSMS